MLLLHSVANSADVGPDLCTLHDLCILHLDLCTLYLWCFPSFKWCKHSTCAGISCHQLQLVLVELCHSSTTADSPLAHLMVPSTATSAGGYFIKPLVQTLPFYLGNLQCVVVCML